MGITMALQLGPQLFLAPVAGLVADRFNRKQLLVLTQSVMALLSAGLGILVVSGAASSGTSTPSPCCWAWCPRWTPRSARPSSPSWSATTTCPTPWP